MNDHETLFRTLPNGVTLVGQTNSGLRSVAVLAAVKVGSRHERAGEHGAAHFIEHMLFKGTRRRPTSRDIATLIDSRGGYHNAFTDRELTGFHVQMAAPDAPVAVDLVHDMLHEPLFRTSDIGKERSVIREEISMYENDPASALWDLVNATAFEGTSLAGPIAGTAEDVGFSPATIKGFFRAHYVPERLVVVLTGAVDDALFALAEKKFSTLRGTFRGTGIAPLAEPRRAGVTFKPGKTDRLHVTVRFPGAPIRCRDRWAHDLLAMILGGYSSSRLNQTVREDKGLCYSVGASSHSHHDVGSLFVGTEIMPDKLDAAMKVIAQVLRRLQPNGLTTDELQAAKRHLRGSRLMANDKPMSQAMNVAYQLCATNTYVSLDAELRAYQRTTLGQVNAVAASLRPENALVCVVGPKESRKDVFNAWDASWNVRGRAGQRTVKRLADGVHDTFLVESST